jgi:hypothetical protein
LTTWKGPALASYKDSPGHFKGLQFFCGFFPVFFYFFPFSVFDRFHWYLQRFAAKLSDLHGACYIWSLDPPGA